MQRFILLLSNVLMLGVVGVLFFYLGSWTSTRDDAMSVQWQIRSTIDAVAPAIVTVTATPETGEPILGTGVIVKADGGVLTSRHILIDSPKVSYTIKTQDGKIYPMDLINRDTVKDLAYFHVRMDKSVSPFIPAKIVLSQALVKRGDMILALGDPVPDKPAIVTQGLVSSLDQSISGTTSGSSLSGLIEITTQLQNGYSGGPVVNLSGEIIGITTALTGNSAGIGWATPIDRKILDNEFEY